jgi:hypothetical protein
MHAFASGIERQDDGNYFVDCHCGERFTGTRREVSVAMNEHLSQHEPAPTISFHLTLSQAERFEAWLSQTFRSDEDELLLAVVRLENAKARKRIAERRAS